jgi:hypothetical protein
MLACATGGQAADPRDELFSVVGRELTCKSATGKGPCPFAVAPGTTDRVCAPEDPTTYVRLRLRAPAGVAGTARIRGVATDSSVDVPVATLLESRWTPRIYDRCAEISVPGGGSPVLVEKMLVPQRPATPKSYFPENDPPDYRDPFADSLAVVKSAAKVTARLVFMKGDDEVTCTGWFLSQDLLMTNFHCIANENAASGVRVEVGYRSWDDEPVETHQGTHFVLGDPGLDFAVLSLYARVATALDPLSWRTGGATQGEDIAVVQHPGGDPVRVARDGDCFVRTNATKGVGDAHVDFGHRCDTEGGSSGSIVVSRDPRCPQIIGLHHWGVVRYHPTAENHAVRIEKVYDHLDALANAGDEAAKRIRAVLKRRACDT